MELGVLIGPQGKLSHTIKGAVRFMNELSPSHFWIPDRLLTNFNSLSDIFPDSPASPPAEFLDPFLTISAMIAAGLNQLEFGIAVTDFIRRAPPDLARASNTISQIAGKPLNIGFGAGEAVNLKPLGYGHRSAPVSFLEHELQIFAEINQSGVCRSGLNPVDLGYNSIPANIWIGGQRARMIGLVARYADGWLPGWKMPASEYKSKRETLEQLAAGYDRHRPKIGMLASVMIGESRKAVLDRIDSSPQNKLWALEMSAELWARWGILHPAGGSAKGTPDVIVRELPAAKLRELASSIPVEMFSEACFLGNADDILEELWEYKAAGMEHVVVMSRLYVDGEGDVEVGEEYSEFKRLCNELKKW